MVGTTKHMATAQIRESRQGQQAAASILGANPMIGVDRVQFADASARLLRILTLNPATLLRHQLGMAGEFARISLGRSELQPDADDIRFEHEIWQRNGYYRRWMQSYLLVSRTLNRMLDEIDVPALDRERARFALSQILAALSPTNHLLGNPEFVSNTLDTRGRSLLRGVVNLVDDMLHNNGMPRQVDERPFKVGGNLACSEGRVVWRSPVCEVIQYGPRSAEVLDKPVLIIPPQINKYYIVDLAEDKSLVRWASEQQCQVFVISWRNPTARLRDWGMESYVDAAKQAVDVVRDVARADSVNLMAACVGGFTATVLAGHLYSVGEGSKINSLTLMGTVLDTDSESLLGLFASDASVEEAIARSRAAGVLDGAEMARSFAWLRPADLVWSYVANNYLLGRAPPAYDVLYWNNDTTRLPAQFHADLLRIFRRNPLVRPNGLKVLGAPVDLKKVDCPVYIVSSDRDHVTPWTACYRSTGLFGGQTRFVLTAGGHVQSVVAPPDADAGYRTNRDVSGSFEQWLGHAQQQPGSWWADWRQWLAPLSGPLKPAVDGYGSARHSPGDAAPGRYVFQR